MKKNLLFAFFFIQIPILLSGQITIKEVIIPDFQDSIPLINCLKTDFLENQAGSDQIWGFSRLILSNESNYPNADSLYGYYENAETAAVFPITYQNTWSDSFDGENHFGRFSSPFGRSN